MSDDTARLAVAKALMGWTGARQLSVTTRGILERRLMLDVVEPLRAEVERLTRERDQLAACDDEPCEACVACLQRIVEISTAKITRLTAEVERLTRERDDIGNEYRSMEACMLNRITEADELRPENARLTAELERAREALAGTHFHHKAYELLCRHCVDALARLAPPTEETT